MKRTSVMRRLVCRRPIGILYVLVSCTLLLAGCDRLGLYPTPPPTPAPAILPTSRVIPPTGPAGTATPRGAAPLGATPLGATPQAPAALTGIVNAGDLRVRQGPGTAEPILANVKQGDRLVILGRNAAGDWLNVRLPNGTTGWVAAQYVTVSGPAQIPTANRATAAPARTQAAVSSPVAPAGTRKGPPQGSEVAQLVKVIDGDTIDVLLDGQNERVRYVGVDAPERAQPGYQAATEANRALLGDGPVYLLRDISDRDQTDSHRLLRYVFLGDGTMVQRELVARGWVQPLEYPPDTFYASEFRQLAAQAAQQQLGFWAPEPPPGGTMPYGLTTGVASLRKSPGPGYEITGALPKGIPFTVYGRTAAGDWLQVRAASRAEGWLNTRFARLNMPVDQAPVVGP